MVEKLKWFMIITRAKQQKNTLAMQQGKIKKIKLNQFTKYTDRHTAIQYRQQTNMYVCIHVGGTAKVNAHVDNIFNLLNNLYEFFFCAYICVSKQTDKI